MDTPELWQFTSSHFNEKARWALDFKRVPHIRHSMIPGFHVATVKRMTGKTHVPVLKLNGTAVSDSSRIIEALEHAYPDPALYPADPAERRRALELEDYFDEELGPYIRRWIFHVDPAVPEVCARCLRIARQRGCSTRAARDVSAHRRDHAAADGYQSCDRRGRAEQDDGRDGSIGARAATVGFPGGRSFYRRRSHSGSVAFAAGQAA